MSEPHVYPNRFADAVGPSDGRPDRDRCDCVGRSSDRPAEVRFHAERQDTTSPGWQHLLALIDEAAADGRPVFRPFVELSPVERRQVITLPPSVATLTEVTHLVLYGTDRCTAAAGQCLFTGVSGGAADTGARLCCGAAPGWP